MVLANRFRMGECGGGGGVFREEAGKRLGERIFTRREVNIERALEGRSGTLDS